MEPDQPFPSESALLREFGVSRVTIRRALAALEADGLIRRVKGKGTFVGSKPAKITPKLTGFTEELLAWKHNTRAKLLELVPVKATRDVATSLGVAEGDIVIRIKRIRYVDQTPLAYIVAHLAKKIGPLVLGDDLERTPIVTLLSKYGIPIVEARQTIEATLADGEMASLLDVKVGAPLLQIVRVYYTDKGDPVDYVRSFYRSDRYQFTVTLKRGSLNKPWEAV